VPVLDANGKLPASVGAVGPQGPAGPEGKQGAQGPPGPVDTSRLLGRTITVRASKLVAGGTAHPDYVVCPSGYEAVGGGAYVSNAFGGHVVDSGPASGGQPLADGSGLAANSWRTTFYNTTANNVLVQWDAVCAKEGA